MTRLRDMGIEPFLVSSSLLGVLAQRLVRTLCPTCKEGYEADAQSKSWFGLEEHEPLTLYKAKGCPACNHKGYRGRTGIHELLVVDTQVQELIHNEAGEQAIERYVRQTMPSIRDDGLMKVRQV